MVFDCKVTKSFLIFDINTAEKIAGDDVDGGGFRVGIACGMIANTAHEAAALHFNVDMGGHEEFDATTEGVDIYLLILSNHSLSQVHADAATEGIETGSVERLAVIDVFVAAIMHATADALAVLTDGQRALQPKATGRRVSGNLVGVTAITVDNSSCAHVQQ